MEQIKNFVIEHKSKLMIGAVVVAIFIFLRKRR